MKRLLKSGVQSRKDRHDRERLTRAMSGYGVAGTSLYASDVVQCRRNFGSFIRLRLVCLPDLSLRTMTRGSVEIESNSINQFTSPHRL